MLGKRLSSSPIKWFRSADLAAWFCGEVSRYVTMAVHLGWRGDGEFHSRGISLQPRKILRRFVPPFVTAIRTHYKHHGAFPRLLNPQTFNEKLCHRKIFDRRKILTQLSDKYAARQYVAQKLGARILPKLFYVTENPADIPSFASLPNAFVVKPTHGSGWVHLVRDKGKLDRQA